MELGKRIRAYRSALGMNQEDLAEKMYVSRQTISSWENEKSYPDVHSLIMLGDLFDVSLDVLIKGDIEIMKEKISQDTIRVFQNNANIFTLLMIVMVVSPIPLLKWGGIAGGAVWAVIAAITMFYAFKVEKQKKEYDIHTYKEIVAFMDGETLEGIEKAREEGKRVYQPVIMMVGSALIAAAVCALMFFILG